MKRIDEDDSPLPVGSMLASLSILLAMGYRRAPVSISPGLVRWFAKRSGIQSADELGRVARLCLLLGDSELVLRELKRSRITPAAGSVFRPANLPEQLQGTQAPPPGEGI